MKIRDLDLEVALAAGERIHTEESHKYGPDEIEDLAKSAGLTAEEQRISAREWGLVAGWPSRARDPPTFGRRSSRPGADLGAFPVIQVQACA